MMPSALASLGAQQRRVQISRNGLGEAGWKVLVGIGMLALPTLLVIADVSVLSGGAWGWDFRAIYNAATDYAKGAWPYPPARLSSLTGQEAFVYPLPAAAAFVPLTYLPWPV